MKRLIAMAAVAAASFLQSGSLPVSGVASAERMSFGIRVVTDGSEPEVLTEATIDGPEGTDFNIDLNTGGFEMKSEFLTDAVSASEVRFRVSLETRRSYGLSRNGLPLYEVDEQEHSISASFDESVVLLPFGRNSGGRTLRVEIFPTRVPAAGDPVDALNIAFTKNLTSGEIAINARKVPHDYTVSARLMKDGEVVAEGKGNALFREKASLALEGYTFGVNLEEFTKSHPSDLATVSFELSRKGGGLVTNGRGIGGLGSEFRYSLDPELGEGYELIFVITENKQQ